MLNFYYNPLSQYAQKVHFFLEQSGHPCSLKLVNLGKGEQRQEAFLKINPFGQVPAIELNGFSMSESNAILRYLAQRGEFFHLYPANLEDRAQVDQLMEFTNLHVNRYLSSLSWNLHWGPMFGMTRNDRVIDESREGLQRTLPKLEKHLGGRSFLAGSNVTLADVVLMPFAAQHRLSQVSFSDFPNIDGWHRRMCELPAWKKVMEDAERMMASLR